MTFSRAFFQILCIAAIASAFLVPNGSQAATDDAVNEKRVEVAMRMIGHEMLNCIGDHSSRVMPVEHTDDMYRIRFGSEFGFDPDDVITIVQNVIAETGAASSCLVEVEQCDTKEVVHSFEIRNGGDELLIPCQGRVLPEDCYSIVVTVLDGRVVGQASQKTVPLKSALMIVSFLLLTGVAGYMVRKKESVDDEPDIQLLGNTKFDKRNMTLSVNDELTDLSHKETELLSILIAGANEPVDRDELLREVWGDEGDYVGRTLDVFISKLRKKLKPDPSLKIVNIRGIGYKLVIGR